MLCCPDCFNDSFIKRHIETFSTNRGTCSFCNSTASVSFINAVELMDLFLPVIDFYQVSEDGLPLAGLLQEDWHIFNESLDSTVVEQLLTSIMDDENLIQLKVKAPENVESQFIKNWEEFSRELRHRNRFFPQKKIEQEQLILLIGYLELDKSCIPDYIYRARLKGDGSPYSIDKMGKPPEGKAPDGRANPKGISYFYGASDVTTAISETRPYKSEIVYVASFSLDNNLKMIDLRNPGKSISPFVHDDLSMIYTEFIPFLNHLSVALSIPVLPYMKDFEYLPTQYLCELIKDNGYDGIIFKSSLGSGDNFVIFDDSYLSGQVVEVYSSKDIIFIPEKISS